MLNDTKNRQAGIGADIMVQPPGSSLLMGVSGAPVSIKVADKLKQLSHVVAVAPVVTQLTTAGSVEVIDGIDMPTFEAMGGRFHYISGGPFEGPYDMLIDDLLASSKHLKVGDTMETLNQPFRIAALWSTARARASSCPSRPCRTSPALRARHPSSTSSSTILTTPTRWCRRSSMYPEWRVTASTR